MRSGSFFIGKTCWMKAQRTVWWDEEKCTGLCWISPFMGKSIQSSRTWLSKNPLFILFCILDGITHFEQNCSFIRIVLKLVRWIFDGWFRDCWQFREMCEAHKIRIEAFAARGRFSLPNLLLFLLFPLLYQHLQASESRQNIFSVDEYISIIRLRYSMTYSHLLSSSNECSSVTTLVYFLANTTVDLKSISTHARFILCWMIDSVWKNLKCRLLWRR